MTFTEMVDATSRAVEAVGIVIIVGGAIVASARAVHASPPFARGRDPELLYRDFRRNLGRAILVGLEFLVAADIIRTVAISPTFENVGVLALIVLIRTFLSFALELEIEGRWPWERSGIPRSAPRASRAED